MPTATDTTTAPAPSTPSAMPPATEAQPALQNPPSAAIHAERAERGTSLTVDRPLRYSAPDPRLRQSLEQSRHVHFTIDEDMILAAQDQARSMGVVFPEWCQRVLNDALRAYLGV